MIEEYFGLSLNTAFYWTVLATVLAGVVRGFAGFGAAMMFIPIVSLVYEPKFAVALLFMIDFITPLPMIPKALKEFEVTEVMPISLGATVTVPLGIYILKHADPTALRYVISISILILVLLLASGWRYKGDVSRLGCFGLGAFSGIAGGIASLYGPPLILFWMSRESKARTIRANIIIFFAIVVAISGISLWFGNLLTLQVFKTGLLLIPIYALAIWIGARLFYFSSETFFKRIAYIMIFTVALFSLPLWQ